MPNPQLPPQPISKETIAAMSIDEVTERLKEQMNLETLLADQMETTRLNRAQLTQRLIKELTSIERRKELLRVLGEEYWNVENSQQV